MLKAHFCLFLICIVSTCFGDSDFEDVYVTFENFREFSGTMPDSIYRIFSLAIAEPKILQPCDSTGWVIGEPAAITWQGASLAKANSIHCEDSVRYYCEGPRWLCNIELYRNGEFIDNIIPPIPATRLPPVDLNSTNNHWYPVPSLRLPRVDVSGRLDRYLPGIGYQVRIISGSSILDSEQYEYVEFWSDPFVIADPLLDIVTPDSSTLWWEDICQAFVSVYELGSYGIVTGVISSELGLPLPGYRIILVQEQHILRADSSARDSIRIEETEFIAITDSLGEYALILPPGRYTWTLRGDFHTGFGLGCLRVQSGSIVPVNYTVQYAELARFHWDTVSTDTSDPEYFHIDSNTSVRISTVNTDPRIDELHLEDILEGTVSIENEWSSANYELERTAIDITEWGQPEFTKGGFVKARVFFDESDASNDWRVVLVYHEKVVVLEENSEPSVFDLGLQTVNCTFSENGRYVIAFDAYGYKYRGGDAIHLDTETGEAIRFDPSPQREYVDPYFLYTAPIIVVGRYNCHPLGHVSNNGGYAILDKYILSTQPARLNLFNDKMELVHAAFSETGNLDEYTGNEISSDGSRICLMGPYQDELCLVIANGDGSISSVKPFIESDRGEMITDEDLSVIMTTRGNSGVYIYSGETGELLHQWHDGELIGRDRRVSPNGSYVSYFLTESIYRDPFNYIIRNLPSGDISFDFKLECDTDSEDKWFVRDGIDLANNGSSLLFLVQNHTGRYVLIDENGLVLWLSPIRRFGRDDMDFHYISDDGQSVAYTNGEYIYILDLIQVSDH